MDLQILKDVIVLEKWEMYRVVFWGSLQISWNNLGVILNHECLYLMGSLWLK